MNAIQFKSTIFFSGEIINVELEAGKLLVMEVTSVDFKNGIINGVDSDRVNRCFDYKQVVFNEEATIHSNIKASSASKALAKDIFDIMDYMLAMDILIPVNDLFDENGGHITKKQYGINLLNRAAIQIKEIFCKEVV